MIYDGYTTGLEDMDDAALADALAKARAECARGCLDMEGMSARVHALEAEIETRGA